MICQIPVPIYAVQALVDFTILSRSFIKIHIKPILAICANHEAKMGRHIPELFDQGSGRLTRPSQYQATPWCHKGVKCMSSGGVEWSPPHRTSTALWLLIQLPMYSPN